jgi:predicted Zn-dependent protease
MRKLLLTGTLLFIFLLGCQRTPITNRRQLKLVSNSDLISMSFQQYNQFLQENRNKIVNGSAADQSLQRVGNKIAFATEAFLKRHGDDNVNRYKWDFTLIQDEIVNAWAMPGGKIAFYTGIMPICANDDGIAVVMGHEIAHAVADHGAERMSQAMLAQGIGVGVQLGTMSKSPQMQQIFNMAYGLTANIAMLRYGRKQESEADEIGLVFSSLAGFDPDESIAFWKRMSSQAGGGGGTPQFLSTHPSYETRIRDLQRQMPRARKIYLAAKAAPPGQVPNIKF